MRARVAEQAIQLNHSFHTRLPFLYSMSHFVIYMFHTGLALAKLFRFLKLRGYCGKAGGFHKELLLLANVRKSFPIKRRQKNENIMQGNVIGLEAFFNVHVLDDGAAA